MSKSLLSLATFFAAFQFATAGEPTPKKHVYTNPNLRFTGDILRDIRHDSLTYDLKLGDENLSYEVKGSVSTDQGFFESDLTHSFVSVVKRSSTQVEEFENNGLVTYFIRERSSRRPVKMAGVSVEGKCISGFFDLGQFYNGLKVDNIPCKGKLDYNRFNGHYTAKNDCSFGDCAIGSTLEKSKRALNYDNFPYGQHTVQVHMTFGELAFNGRINMTRSGSPGIASASDGIVVIHRAGTTAHVAVWVTKKDGSRPVFSNPGEVESKDDEQVRKFLAWFQLNAFDLLEW